MFGMAVGPDANATLWTTGSFANFSSNPIDFGAGPVSSTGGADVYLNKVSATGLTATQTFTFGFAGGYDQVGTGVAVASTKPSDPNAPTNVVLVGNYLTKIEFDPIYAGNSDAGPTYALDFLNDASNMSGAAMNFFLVADGASVMPEITPLKAHSIDVGTGAIQAIASNPSQSKVAICGKTNVLVSRYTATSTGLLTAGSYGTGPTNKATYPSSANAMDIVVAVIEAGDPNSVGKVIWGRQFGGVGDQACESVAIDSAGNVAIAGNYNGVLNFDPSNTALQLTKSGGSISTTLALPFVAVLDPNGTPVYAADWGTSGVSDVNGIAFDKSSPANIVIGGSLGATITMPKADASLITVTDQGKTDGFVAKLNPNLSAQWAMSFGDTSYGQAVKSLALSSTGNVFIGGSFEGTLTGLNGLTSNGNATTDAFSGELSGVDGSVMCAQEYGDSQGTQSANFVTVANGTTGSLANNVVYGGSYSNTITFGSSVLNSGSPGTGYNFLARLIP
jgi:hypothetical protein